MNRRIDAGLVFVCAAALLSPALGRRASAAAPAHVDRPPGKRSPGKTRPLRFSCSDALDDGTLTDFRMEDALVNLAQVLRRPGDVDPATRGRRDVRLFCGPDLDGDGDREAIVQVTWWPTAGATTGSPLTVALLASKHLGAWRAMASLSLDGDEDRQASEQAITFVKRPGGKPAVRIERSNFTSDAGCRIVGYEILELRSGVLQRLEVGDASPPCTPCGCDPH